MATVWGAHGAPGPTDIRALGTIARTDLCADTGLLYAAFVSSAAGPTTGGRLIWNDRLSSPPHGGALKQAGIVVAPRSGGHRTAEATDNIGRFDDESR